MTENHDHDALHDHDRGLSHDLPLIVRRGMGRRGLLALFGGVGAIAVAGCGADDSTSTAGTSASSSDSGSGSGQADPPSSGGDTNVSAADGEIPEETAGPYPADGSNGVDVLSESGVVRSDPGDHPAIGRGPE